MILLQKLYPRCLFLSKCFDGFVREKRLGVLIGRVMSGNDSEEVLGCALVWKKSVIDCCLLIIVVFSTVGVCRRFVGGVRGM